VPGASIGYQRHLLSLKVMSSQTEQAQLSFTGNFGWHGSQCIYAFTAVGESMPAATGSLDRLSFSHFFAVVSKKRK